MRTRKLIKSWKVAALAATMTAAAIHLRPRMTAMWEHLQELTASEPFSFNPAEMAEINLKGPAGDIKCIVPWSMVEEFSAYVLSRLLSDTFINMREWIPGDSTNAKRWSEHLPAEALAEAMRRGLLDYSQYAGYIVLMEANREAFNNPLSDHEVQRAVAHGLSQLNNRERMLVRLALPADHPTAQAAFDELLTLHVAG